MSEFVIVGLGNPGTRYALTRHNVGFLFLDEFLKKYPPSRVSKKESEILYRTEAEGMNFLLVRPLTFMNLSGRIFYDLKVFEPPLVVHDDLDLPLGRMRIRKSGSSGGQKGLKSIMETLGTLNVPRIRVGIGPKRADAVDHVLGRFSEDELAVVNGVVELCVEASLRIAKDGIDAAMNRYNSIRVGDFSE